MDLSVLYQEKKENEDEQLSYFKELFSLVYNDLYRFIYSIALNKYLAEDILQETAIIGYKHFYELKDKEKFKSWIFTIAKREAFWQLKRNRRELLLGSEEYQSILEYENIEDINFVDTPEIHSAIVDVINDLPDNYKDIINLVYYIGFTLVEIAEMTNENYNTVKSRHRRALKCLEGKLKEMGFASYP